MFQFERSWHKVGVAEAAPGIFSFSMLSSSLMCDYIISKHPIKKSIKENITLTHRNSGRGANGRVVCRTKGQFYNKRFINKLSMPDILTTLPFVVRKLNVKPYLRTTSLVMLSGSCTLNTPTSVKSKIGVIFYKEQQDGFFFFGTLGYFGLGANVSYIQMRDFFLASSVGARCTIMFGRDDLFAITLPSGQLMFIHYSTKCVNSEPDCVNRPVRASGSKLLRVTGTRPIVRGIAKNPNDHPHGGRTNSVENPMTPWGKTVRKCKKSIVHRVWLKKRIEREFLLKRDSMSN